MATSKAPSSRGRPKTFDREHVIDVAMDSYWREGIDALSLNELCRRSGVSKPSLYREFGGEDGLMDAALEHYAMSVLVPMITTISTELPFRESLETLITFMTDPKRAGPAGCLLAKMRIASAHLGPTTRARVEALRAGATSAYAGWIAQAKVRGEIAQTIPTDVAAAFMDTQLTTLILQMGEGESPESLRAQAELTFAGLLGMTL